MSAFYNVDQPPFNMGSVARAIAAANNGLLFDPSDMTTLYQDAAGTIPVTAVEQPVGKMLDKSGNNWHATQSITASRPVLSARYNLLTKTEDFSDAVWDEINLTTTSNTAIAPDGTLTADTLTTTVVAHAKFQAFACSPNTQYTFSFYAKRGTMTDAKYSVYNLTVAGDIVAATSYYSAINADTFSRVSITFTTPANCTSCRVYPLRDSGVIGTIHVWGADLRLGTTSGPYQRVNTATDYDTDERYFPKYLSFDGVDDYLNLPYMGLYAGGGMSIIATRDAVSQSTDTYIISERSITDADPKYFPSRQLASAGNMDAYIADDAGAVVLDTTGSAFGGASNAVVRSAVDAGNNIKLFKNGALAASDNYTRAGTLTLNTTAIGASVSTTTSNYAKMKLYGLLITKSALSDAQRVRCERFLARKAGVML